MPEYKKTLIGYRNESKKQEGRYYYSIKNVSGEPITIDADGVLFLDEVPADVREKYETMPLMSKSVKIED